MPHETVHTPASPPAWSRPGPAAALAAALAVAVGAAGCGLPRAPSLPEPAADPRATPPPEAAALLAGAEPGPDCFQRHLHEAISLNERRRPLYSAWSEGGSEAISNRLILLERLALLAAAYVDHRARRFQEAGVPIGCAEFASMSLTPPLGRSRPAPVRMPFEPGPDPDSLGAALVRAYGSGGFPAVAMAADETLHELERAPDYHCMVRHLVESVWRVAALAPAHATAAATARLPATEPLSELLLRLHLAALPEGARLDRQAAPLQQGGIPILCRDVPSLR